VRQEKLGRPNTSRTQCRAWRVRSGRSGPAVVERRLQGALITFPSQQPTATVDSSQEPRAVVPHAGICAGGRP
jgi:hypothetical protein